MVVGMNCAKLYYLTSPISDYWKLLRLVIYWFVSNIKLRVV